MSTQRAILIHKRVGMTPLEAIRMLQSTHPEYQHKKLGYAGRLDPMASGLLLILVDEENLQRKEYEKLPKTYQCQALFGITTDSYDLLGLVTAARLPFTLTKMAVEEILPDYVGTYMQPYPPYSSPRVQGHPLFWWARENRLSEITIPQKQITINSITLLAWQIVTLGALQEDILKRINSVQGEFRQEEISASWRDVCSRQSTQQTVLVTLEVECSSGTYIRSLVHELGKKNGCGALAYSITRTHIGEYTLNQALSLLPGSQDNSHHDE